jgi:hypothetical protein
VQNCENISSSVLNRLIKEVKEYTKTPVQDIALLVNEENFTDLRAELRGPGVLSARFCSAVSLRATPTLSRSDAPTHPS